MIGLSSCEDFLDPKPSDGTYEDDFVWSNPSYAKGILYSSYQSLPYTSTVGGLEFLEVATEDAVSNDLNSSMGNFAMGQLSPGDNYLNVWAAEYERIRNLNLFLEKGLELRYHSDSVTNVQLVERFKGEALFLRAYMHWKLLKYYGGTVDGVAMGVPYINEVLPSEAIDKVSRPTYQQCADLIYEDCDSAYKYLPETYTGTDLVTGAQHYGGATSHAAKALKSIVALFNASPAFNPSNDMDKWEDVVNFAIDALTEIDGVLNAARLPARNFFDPENADVIWRGRYIKDYGMEIKNLPPSVYGGGLNNPSQNLVDAFFMANGYPIDDPANRGYYNPDSPYAGRDRRFNENIIFNGALFNGKVINTFEGGADSYSTDLRGSRTGYFVRKFMSPTVELYPQQKNSQYKYYTIISKTELYFALAESLNEFLGNPNNSSYGISAKQALSKIRQRAYFFFFGDGYLQEKANEGKEAFLELIKNERRVEMCFEDRRFWDLRRWGDQLDDVPVYGAHIIQDNSGDIIYGEPVLIETRTFKSPFLPLPHKEVVLLDNVAQNDGW